MNYTSLPSTIVDSSTPITNSAPKLEKAKRPELGVDISEEDWSYFISRWSEYKIIMGLSNNDLVVQLMECCVEELRLDHHSTFPSNAGNASITEEVRLNELRQLAVRKIIEQSIGLS